MNEKEIFPLKMIQTTGNESRGSLPLRCREEAIKSIELNPERVKTISGGHLRNQESGCGCRDFDDKPPRRQRFAHGAGCDKSALRPDRHREDDTPKQRRRRAVFLLQPGRRWNIMDESTFNLLLQEIR